MWALSIQEVGPKSALNSLWDGTTTPRACPRRFFCWPMPKRSLGGSRYFITFIDDCTQKVRTYSIKSKDEALVVFAWWLAKVENRSSHKVKILRLDNGPWWIHLQRLRNVTIGEGDPTSKKLFPTPQCRYTPMGCWARVLWPGPVWSLRLVGSDTLSTNSSESVFRSFCRADNELLDSQRRVRAEVGPKLDSLIAKFIVFSWLPYPTPVVVIDGRPIASGKIVEESEPISVVLDNFTCVVSFNIISSPEHPIVLGLPWFELHNPDIDWRTREIQHQAGQGSFLRDIWWGWAKFLSMKQELAPESRSANTCTREILLVLIPTWARKTLLTCLEGMEPLIGCKDLELSNQTAPILART